MFTGSPSKQLCVFIVWLPSALPWLKLCKLAVFGVVAVLAEEKRKGTQVQGWLGLGLRRFRLGSGSVQVWLGSGLRRFRLGSDWVQIWLGRAHV